MFNESKESKQCYKFIMLLSFNTLMTVENKCFDLHLNWAEFPAANLN